MTNQDARRLRRRAKLSQKQIADELDIPRESYTRWETGARGLPWERTVAEVFEAIDRLGARKNNPDS